RSMRIQTLVLLLVEDDPASAESIRRSFHAFPSPSQLEIAPSLACARQLLSDRPFDLVLAKWQLPDGMATDLLTSQKPESPIALVVLAGPGEEAQAAEALRAGAVA